jgi:solute carrier family 25 (mitochondrial phosphate transporter), member 23/24/25/41
VESFISFKQYNGAIDAARHVFKAEGIVGFYRGMWPNLSQFKHLSCLEMTAYLSPTVKAMPATAAQFWVYELIKEYLMVQWKSHLN